MFKQLTVTMSLTDHHQLKACFANEVSYGLQHSNLISELSNAIHDFLAGAFKFGVIDLSQT